MDICLLPIRIKKDGEPSVLVKTNTGQKSLLRIFHPNLPDNQTIVNFLGRYMPQVNLPDLKIEQLPAPYDTPPCFIVAGNEEAFSQTFLGSAANCKWHAYDSVARFTAYAGRMTGSNSSLRGTLESDDLSLMLAGLHTVRAMRAGIERTEETFHGDLGFVRLIAQDGRLATEAVDSKIDFSLPRFAERIIRGRKRKMPSAESVIYAWEQYRYTFSNLASIAATDKVAITVDAANSEVFRHLPAMARSSKSRHLQHV